MLNLAKSAVCARSFAALAAVILLCTSASAQSFQFDGSMSRQVLENYLDRSISFTELFTTI